jgi:hypothetical protein
MYCCHAVADSLDVPPLAACEPEVTSCRSPYLTDQQSNTQDAHSNINQQVDMRQATQTFSSALSKDNATDEKQGVDIVKTD